LGDRPISVPAEVTSALAPAARPSLRIAGRGLPGGNSLFFCFAKRKVSKRKGDPGCCVPPLRCGQPVVLGPDGVSLNSLRSNNAIPDPSGPALLGASTRGGSGEKKSKQPNTDTEYLKKQGLAAASPCLSWFVLCVLSPLPLPLAPSWLGRGAQTEADQGSRLFEPKASLRETPPESSTAGCPKRSAGTQTAGRLFFGNFLLAKQKKVTCCRQPRPATLSRGRSNQKPLRQE
jgi:hypothetical protein